MIINFLFCHLTLVVLMESASLVFYFAQPICFGFVIKALSFFLLNLIQNKSIMVSIWSTSVFKDLSLKIDYIQYMYIISQNEIGIIPRVGINPQKYKIKFWSLSRAVSLQNLVCHFYKGKFDFDNCCLLQRIWNWDISIVDGIKKIFKIDRMLKIILKS